MDSKVSPPPLSAQNLLIAFPFSFTSPFLSSPLSLALLPSPAESCEAAAISGNLQCRRAAGLSPAAESASAVVCEDMGAGLRQRVGRKRWWWWWWCLRSGNECKNYFHFPLMTWTCSEFRASSASPCFRVTNTCSAPNTLRVQRTLIRNGSFSHIYRHFQCIKLPHLDGSLQHSS